MNELKAYANQVVSYHPESSRDELFAELYDSLCEEFEDWQNNNPQAGEGDFLESEKGHPMRYASKLAPEGSNYLVGPSLYYSLIAAWKTGLVITTAVYVLLALVAGLGSGRYVGSFMGVFAGLPGTLLWVSACILGVFVALDRNGENASWLDRWSAEDLRPIDHRRRISRTEVLFEMSFSTLGLLWVLDVVEFPTLVRHDGEWLSGWNSAIADWVWVVMAILLAIDIAFSVYKLVREYWTPMLRGVSIVNNLVWIGVLSFIQSYPQLLQFDDSDSKYTDIVELVNRSVDILIWIVITVIAVDTLGHLWRLLKK